MIRVVHDECTYYANSDQSYFWGDNETNALRQILILWMNCQAQARLPLETHKQGYFINDHLLEQVTKTVDIFECIHHNSVGVFMFDNAPSHRKVADDAPTCR